MMYCCCAGPSKSKKCKHKLDIVDLPKTVGEGTFARSVSEENDDVVSRKLDFDSDLIVPLCVVFPTHHVDLASLKTQQVALVKYLANNDQRRADKIMPINLTHRLQQLNMFVHECYRKKLSDIVGRFHASKEKLMLTRLIELDDIEQETNRMIDEMSREESVEVEDIIIATRNLVITLNDYRKECADEPDPSIQKAKDRNARLYAGFVENYPPAKHWVKTIECCTSLVKHLRDQLLSVNNDHKDGFLTRNLYLGYIGAEVEKVIEHAKDMETSPDLAEILNELDRMKVLCADLQKGWRFITIDEGKIDAQFSNEGKYVASEKSFAEFRAKYPPFQMPPGIPSGMVVNCVARTFHLRDQLIDVNNHNLTGLFNKRGFLKRDLHLQYVWDSLDEVAKEGRGVAELTGVVRELDRMKNLCQNLKKSGWMPLVIVNGKVQYDCTPDSGRMRDFKLDFDAKYPLLDLPPSISFANEEDGGYVNRCELEMLHIGDQLVEIHNDRSCLTTQDLHYNFMRDRMKKLDEKIEKRLAELIEIGEISTKLCHISDELKRLKTMCPTQSHWVPLVVIDGKVEVGTAETNSVPTPFPDDYVRKYPNTKHDFAEGSNDAAVVLLNDLKKKFVAIYNDVEIGQLAKFRFMHILEDEVEHFWKKLDMPQGPVSELMLAVRNTYDKLGQKSPPSPFVPMNEEEERVCVCIPLVGLEHDVCVSSPELPSYADMITGKNIPQIDPGMPPSGSPEY